MAFLAPPAEYPIMHSQIYTHLGHFLLSFYLNYECVLWLAAYGLSRYPFVFRHFTSIEHMTHSLADSARNVYTSGRNSEGQLGLGDNVIRETPVAVMGLMPVSAVSAGNMFTLLLGD